MNLLTKYDRRSLRQGIGGPARDAADNTADILTAGAFSSGSDTFTGATSGVALNRTALYAVCRFALSVKGTNTQVGTTTWTVVLEGSLDGVTYTTLLTHAYPATADGATVFPAAGILTPCLYFRSRCTALTLGTATNIIATILGMP